MKKLFIFVFITLFFVAMQSMLFATERAFSSSSEMGLLSPVGKEDERLAYRVMPLTNRHAVPSVNDVFRDNILLTIRYMSGEVKNVEDINWDAVRQPFTYEFTLQPGEVFAYHDGVLPEYRDKVKQTTNAHFNAQEGFLFSGLLYGDGVCHLASLMNWAARDAGLKVESRVSHDFANIPDVPREYGTSIYADPGETVNEQIQNLYIQNTLDKPVKMAFEYKDGKLSVAVYK